MQLDSTRQRPELALRGVIVGHVASVQQGLIQRVYSSWEVHDEARSSFLDKVSWSRESWKKCAMALTCGSDFMGYPSGDISSHLSDFAAALLSGKVDWALKDLIALDKVNHPELGDVVGANELEVLAQNGQAD